METKELSPIVPNYEIGGEYIPKAKVKTSTRGDCGLVVYDEKTRFCHHKKRKRSRAVTVVSANTQVSEYSGKHAKLVQENGQRGNEYMITIDTISAYPCDNNTTKILESMLPTLKVLMQPNFDYPFCLLILKKSPS